MARLNGSNCNSCCPKFLWTIRPSQGTLHQQTHWFHFLPPRYCLYGRLLVLQSCRSIFTNRVASFQRLQRSRHSQGHLPAVYHHLYARNNWCSTRDDLCANASSGAQMVACLFCSLSRPLHGHVHSSQEYSSLCWLKRS